MIYHPAHCAHTDANTRVASQNPDPTVRVRSPNRSLPIVRAPSPERANANRRIGADTSPGVRFRRQVRSGSVRVKIIINNK
eukprot:1186537-Prorocentrum_minimum.AAC.2